VARETTSQGAKASEAAISSSSSPGRLLHRLNSAPWAHPRSPQRLWSDEFPTLTWKFSRRPRDMVFAAGSKPMQSS